MPFNLGFGELLVVMVVALLVFGGRLPQVGRSLGQGLLQFKKGLSDAADESIDSEDSTGDEAESGVAGLLETPHDEVPVEPDGVVEGTEPSASPRK